MNEIYVPSAKADELSRALWSLARPPEARRGSDITSSMFRRVTDLQDSKWLVVLDDYSVSIHPQAELNGLADILQPWIDDGLLPADTNTQLAGYVNAMRGKSLVVYQAFPPLFKLADASNPTGLGRTKEQMIKEGRLPTPNIP